MSYECVLVCDSDICPKFVLVSIIVGTTDEFQYSLKGCLSFILFTAHSGYVLDVEDGGAD